MRKVVFRTDRVGKKKIKKGLQTVKEAGKPGKARLMAESKKDQGFSAHHLTSHPFVWRVCCFAVRSCFEWLWIVVGGYVDRIMLKPWILYSGGFAAKEGGTNHINAGTMGGDRPGDKKRRGWPNWKMSRKKRDLPRKGKAP